MGKGNEKKERKGNPFLRFLKGLVFFLIALVLVSSCWSWVDRASGYNAPFFGLRASVISSESMETVNPEYEDFLEGHDDRYRKNDVVIARMPSSLEELEVYDAIGSSRSTRAPGRSGRGGTRTTASTGSSTSRM